MEAKELNPPTSQGKVIDYRDRYDEYLERAKRIDKKRAQTEAALRAALEFLDRSMIILNPDGTVAHTTQRGFREGHPGVMEEHDLSTWETVFGELVNEQFEPVPFSEWPAYKAMSGEKSSAVLLTRDPEDSSRYMAHDVAAVPLYSDAGSFVGAAVVFKLLGMRPRNGK